MPPPPPGSRLIIPPFSAFGFLMLLTRKIIHVAKIVSEIMPRIYDTETGMLLAVFVLPIG